VKDVCILLGYHLDNEPTRRNFELLRRKNPDIDIHPLLFGDVQPYLPGSIIYRRSFPVPPGATTRWYWAQCDLLIYDFFQQHAERYERYVYLEWDVICNTSVREVYQEVWQADFAGRTPINYAQRRNDWYHFRQMPYEKQCYFSAAFLAAVAPLCGVMLSEHGLQAVVENVHRHWVGFREMFSEARIATAARLAGFDMQVCERLNHARFHSFVVPFEPRMLEEPGIYHAVKELGGTANH